MDTRRPRVVTVAFWLLLAAAVLWARVRRGLWKARIGVTAAAACFLVVPGSRAWDFVDPRYPFGRGYAVSVIMTVVLTATGVALLHGRRGNTNFPRRPR